MMVLRRTLIEFLDGYGNVRGVRQRHSETYGGHAVGDIYIDSRHRAVVERQSPPDVAEADAARAGSGLELEFSGIRDLDEQPVGTTLDTEPHESVSSPGRNAVLDRVFDQRLDRENTNGG